MNSPRTSKNDYPLLLLLIKKAFAISPSFFLIGFSLVVFEAFTPLLFVLLPGAIIDELFGAQRKIIILKYVLTLSVGSPLISIINSFLSSKMEIQKKQIDESLSFLISSNLASIDYPILEDSAFLEKYHRHMAGKNRGASIATILSQLMQTIKELLKILLYLFFLFNMIDFSQPTNQNSILFFIASNTWLVVSVLLFIDLGLLHTKKKNNDSLLKSYDAFLPSDRKYSYYQKLSKDLSCLKDIRVFSFFPLLSDYIQAYRSEARALEQNILNLQLRQNTSVSIFVVFEKIIIYSIAGLKVFFGMISYGQFYIYINCLRNSIKSIESIMDITENVRYALRFQQSFKELSELKGQENDGISMPASFESLAFDDVWFKYPGTDKYILRGVSFKIKKGEKVTLVGVNGAGKSTIVKLICRFYSPTKGIIRLNDVNIESFNKTDYQHWITTLFQEVNYWAGTLKENIAFNKELPLISSIVSAAGLDSFCDKNNGLQTSLTRLFDENGILLSGGEVQKLGLARAMAHNLNLILFDEPTSSLDPISELEIMKKLDEIFHNTTVFTISHRLSFSKESDIIYVLDNGIITEAGTHEELLKTKGLYHLLWQTQAETYKIV